MKNFQILMILAVLCLFFCGPSFAGDIEEQQGVAAKPVVVAGSTDGTGDFGTTERLRVDDDGVLRVKSGTSAGTPTSHRSSVSSNDSGWPEDTTGSIECAGYSKVKLYVTITGTSPTGNITFGEWNGSVYGKKVGFPVTVSENTVIEVPVSGSSNVYCKIDSLSGTTPVISIDYSLIK